MARGRRNYHPAMPFNVSMRIVKPTIEKVKGVPTKKYPALEECEQFFGSFRTFGGTETTVNDLFTVEDTVTIDTWFRPDITADCEIYIEESKQYYEVLASPEDIEMRHQFLQIRARKIGGKA